MTDFFFCLRHQYLGWAVVRTICEVHRMDHELWGFRAITGMSFECTDWIVLSESSQTQGFYLPKYKPDRAARAPGKAVARVGPQGAADVMTWVLVMWLHSTCKFIKLHSTMPAVFSVYVMLLKEWKLNKTASMWLCQESLPITVWWHCSQRQNPESRRWEMRLKTLERRLGTGRRGEDMEQWDFITRECAAPTPWR